MDSMANLLDSSPSAKEVKEDPPGAGQKALWGVGSVAIFVMVWKFGNRLGDWLTERIDNLAGTNASGRNTFDFGSLE